MTKRAAEYDLNEKDINGPEKERDQTQMKKSTPEEIAARRIVKVKRDDETANKNDTPSKVSFSIAEPTTDDKKTGEKSESKQSDSKPAESIFGKIDVSNLFNNKPGETGINLFGKPTPAAVPISTNFSSLFANLPKPAEASTSSLFATAASSTAGNGGGLFGNISTTPGLLFGNLGGDKTALSSSILNFGEGVPPMSRTAGSDDEEGDDDEGAKPEHIDPSKSTGTYVYESPFTRKLEKRLTKYRLNANDVVEDVEVSIEEEKEKKELFVVVRLHATKKTVYMGRIMDKLSSVRRIGQHTESLEVKTVSANEQTGKPKLDVLRLKFESKEAAEEFENCFKESLKQ